MKSGRDWLKSIGPVIGGLIAGAVASIFISNASSRSIGREVHPQIHDTQLIPAKAGVGPFPGPSTAGVNQDKRIADLEQRLEEFEKNKDGDHAQQAAPDDSVTPEEHRAAMAEAHQQAIDAHTREPVDPAWARSTEGAFEDDLKTLAADDELTVRGVQCRSNTCSASFEWSNYEKARSTYPSILHKNYKANCTRTILLPEPADPNQPYRATALYDCSAWKAGIAN